MTKYERVKTFLLGVLTAYLVLYACYPTYYTPTSSSVVASGLEDSTDFEERIARIEKAIFGKAWSLYGYNQSIRGLLSGGLLDRTEDLERKVTDLEWDVRRTTWDSYDQDGPTWSDFSSLQESVDYQRIAISNLFSRANQLETYVLFFHPLPDTARGGP